MRILTTTNEATKYRGLDGYIWRRCLFCDFRVLSKLLSDRSIVFEHMEKCELSTGLSFNENIKVIILCV